MSNYENTPQFLQQYFQSNWTEKLRIKLDYLKDSELQLKLDFHKRMTNFAGVVHGGSIAAIMHDAGSLLAEHCLNQFAETSDCQIFFLSAAKNTDLRFKAKILKRSKRLAFIQVDAINDNEQVVCQCLCSFRTHAKPSVECHWQEKYLQLLDKTVSDHPTKAYWDTLVHKPKNGMYLEQMGEGYCRIKLDDNPRYFDRNGEVANGALLSVADNVGSFASATELTMASNGSTISLQASFFDRIEDESLICFAEFIAQAGSQLNSHFFIVGEKSKKLKAIGSTTLWIKMD